MSDGPHRIKNIPSRCPVMTFESLQCLQGSLDMSAEEMALCSSIADFRNSMYNFDEPWSAADVRGVTDKILMQLFDVRSLSTSLNLLLVVTLQGPKHGSKLLDSWVGTACTALSKVW